MQRKYKLACLALIWLIGTLGGSARLRAGTVDEAEILFSAPWYGSYVCNQGLTRLELRLRPLPGKDGVEADFSFSADPDNPSVPRGSFHMTGSLNRQNHKLVLKQDHWLEQPADSSYRMVDLEGQLFLEENRALIHGRILNYGCEDFSVWQFMLDNPTKPQ